MALSDLAVFSEYAYSSMTEVVAQQVELFNAASQNTITLTPAANQGDYNDKAHWKKISGLVRRRNAYGSGAVSEKVLEHLVDTMVKVASGTPPVRIDPGMLKWIQRSEEEAGVVIGQQLAGDLLADMLNTAILAGYTAMAQNSAMLYDATGDTPDELSYSAMNKAAAKFGDRSGDIRAWVSHSVPYHDLIGANLTNSNDLFRFETVAVTTDHIGRPIIISDSPSLLDTTPTPDVYYCLGLTTGALNVEQNNDFDTNVDKSNGDENIVRTWQGEWSYNLGVKGYAWDKTNGGKSPTDAALAVSTNWDKYVTSDKDGPGVLLKVDFAA